MSKKSAGKARMAKEPRRKKSRGTAGAILSLFLLFIFLSGGSALLLMRGMSTGTQLAAAVVYGSEPALTPEGEENAAAALVPETEPAGEEEPAAESVPVVETTPEPVRVTIGGREYEKDAASVELKQPTEAAELLASLGELEQLETVVLAYVPELSELNSLQRSFSGINLEYSGVSSGDKVYPSATEELEFSYTNEAELEKFLEVLPALPNLESIKVVGSAELPVLERVAKAAPNAGIDYEISVYGLRFNLNASEVVYKQYQIGNAGLDAFRSVLPCMNKLDRLVLDQCGADNEVLDAFNKEFPDVNIVWRVFFDNYCAMTDDVMIRATNSLTDYRGIENLKYCTEARFIDMGHNVNLSNIDFVSYMPHLKVFIIVDSQIESLEPLRSCKELEMLEITTCVKIKDLSPLADCTSLRLLNYSNLNECTDISPLYGLTNLERCFASYSPAPQEQKDELVKRLPDCWCTFTRPGDSAVSYNYSMGWRLDAAPNERADWYKELREIFGIGYYKCPIVQDEGYFSFNNVPAYSMDYNNLQYFSF